VGQGVGGEGAQGDEAPGDALAQVGDGDAVVPGQRPIGAEGGRCSEQPVHVGDRLDAALDLVDGDIAQLAIQQKARQHHGTESDQRPDQVAALQFWFGFYDRHRNSSLARPELMGPHASVGGSCSSAIRPLCNGRWRIVPARRAAQYQGGAVCTQLPSTLTALCSCVSGCPDTFISMSGSVPPARRSGSLWPG